MYRYDINNYGDDSLVGNDGDKRLRSGDGEDIFSEAAIGKAIERVVRALKNYHSRLLQIQIT